jgi:hypothetical protein
MFENVIRKTKPKPTVSVSRSASGRGIVLGIRTGNLFADGLLDQNEALALVHQINAEVAEQLFGDVTDAIDDTANIMEGEPVTEIATPFAGWPVPVHLIDAAPVSIL